MSYARSMTDPIDRPGASPERLCEILGITRPVVLAPMAKVAGGVLASAVSNAGGLGILGGGYGDALWLEQQVALAGGARVGIGIITWNMSLGAIEMILGHAPCAIWLAFGELAPHVEAIRGAGVAVLCQVATVDEAVEAVDAGADVIVAQGTESGGHGRPQHGVSNTVARLSEALPDTPLVAAGGINTQADLDHLRTFGAAGAALGTAFYATAEALDHAVAKRHLVELSWGDTVRSTVYDVVRGPRWPDGYNGRSARTTLTDQWQGREKELQDDLDAQRATHDQAVVDVDMSARVLWAGEGVGGIDSIVPAAEIVERFTEVR